MLSCASSRAARAQLRRLPRGAQRFEDVFQAYERGLAAFKYPYVLQIWKVYPASSSSASAAASSSVRGTLEQVDRRPPRRCTSSSCHAKLEEEHGLMRNAMAVYQRAVDTVAVCRREEMHNMYIAKAAEYFDA